MGKTDFESARAYALDQLEKKLSPQLVYHSMPHTRDDVVPAVERLADMEHIGGEERLLLVSAAYFHDIGFTLLTGNRTNDDWIREHHEEISIEFIQRELPRFGYSKRQLKTMAGIILSTRIPQTPHNTAEEIMADADLDSLGRSDFWQTSKALRQEMEAFGQLFSNEEWFTFELRFLESHQYFTQAARSLRDEQKLRNRLEISQILQRLQNGVL